MTDKLKVATGWNNTGGLAFVSPQPAFSPIAFAKYYPGMSGVVYAQAPYLECKWKPGLGENDWLTVVAAFGLSFVNAVYSAKVTVAIPTMESGTLVNYNGMAAFFGPPAKNFFIWTNAVIIVRNLVAI